MKIHKLKLHIEYTYLLVYLIQLLTLIFSTSFGTLSLVHKARAYFTFRKQVPFKRGRSIMLQISNVIEYGST